MWFRKFSKKKLIEYFRSHEEDEPSENGHPDVSVAEKVRSYIFESDYEDGAWLR